MNPFRTLGLVGWLVVGCVALVIVCAGLWWATGGARRDAAIAKANAAFSDSKAKSGADAGQTLDKAHQASTDNEALSRENADAIRNAPGADQRLDPSLNRAALERLCRREAYRNEPDCLQFTGRAKPSR